MRISGQSALLVLSLLVVALASSALTRSVSALSTQNNVAETAASTKNVTQNLDSAGSNVSESQLTNSDPFKEMGSIQKMNLSNALISQDKHLSDKDKNHSSSSSPQASDASCAKDGNRDCIDNQKTSKKNNDSKNKDSGNKEQKHNIKPDVNSIKDEIKSDIKNRFKLPIDIPFP